MMRMRMMKIKKIAKLQNCKIAKLQNCKIAKLKLQKFELKDNIYISYVQLAQWQSVALIRQRSWVRHPH